MRLAWLFISFQEISHPLESTVIVQRFVLVQNQVIQTAPSVHTICLPDASFGERE